MTCRPRLLLAPLLVLCITHAARGGAISWDSATIGGPIAGELRLPEKAAAGRDGTIATIIYLKNLSIPRHGREADEPIIADLLRDGCQILVLDYAKHPSATSPALAADILKLRQDIGGKTRTLLTDQRVDVDHLFILPEGFRLKRDVEFERDGSRVLAMDVIYPSKPLAPVPALVEITCDNTNRMGNLSLLFCHDTLLEGGALAGFAVAMVDHPVPPPYKGIDDPMPECLERMKAAVAKLRSMSAEVHLDGRIGAMGFSRGGPFAAMLACTRDVRAALIHGNRYDYLDLGPDDPMLGRFEKAWGPRDANRDRWAAHGAAFYLTKDAAPMFLNTSDAESPEYRKGLADFDRRLTELGVDHVYQLDHDGRGHHVTTDPKTLAAIYAFFHKHLDR